jgi:hypothetical protein
MPHIHTLRIPYIQNSVEITIGCGISHTNTSKYKITKLTAPSIRSISHRKVKYTLKPALKAQTNTENHNIDTRQINNLHLPQGNLTIYQKGANYLGIKIFNNLYIVFIKLLLVIYCHDSFFTVPTVIFNDMFYIYFVASLE